MKLEDRELLVEFQYGFGHGVMQSPAILFRNNFKRHEIHHANGPAAMFVSGEIHYAVHNKWHNEKGPAHVCASGFGEFYLDNTEITEVKWLNAVKRLNELIK